MSYFQRKFHKPKENVRTCQYPGCEEEGLYRAPQKGKKQDIKKNETWHWFCLGHVREYNAKWNYYANMNEDEIISHWWKDITWERPSWPLGHWQTRKYQEDITKQKPFFKDPFGIFEDYETEFYETSSSYTPYRVSSPEYEAMHVLGLSPQFSQEELQRNYRELVKRYHPDVNGGSPEAEEQIKIINQAYHLLKQSHKG